MTSVTKDQFISFLKDNNAFEKFATNLLTFSPEKSLLDLLKDGHELRIIDSAFIWSGTPEGHGYWSDLHTKFVNHCLKSKFLGTKVFVGTKSKEIQQKLLSLGFRWASGNKEVLNEDKPFLYIEPNGILYGSDYRYFLEHKHREISIKDILGE